MTTMINGNDLNVLKSYWESFDAKHPDFDMDKNLLFHPDIEIKKDWILLDLGCGPGRLARLSYNLIKQYYGIDISSAMIEQAKTKNYKNAKFFVNDGHTLKFKDNFFDVVVVATVFQHVGKWIIKSYVDEIYRTLKPRGFLIANFPRISFYKDYGYTKEELSELLKKFEWKELDCDKEPEKIDYRINMDAHFYVVAKKNG